MKLPCVQASKHLEETSNLHWQQSTPCLVRIQNSFLLNHFFSGTQNIFLRSYIFSAQINAIGQCQLLILLTNYFNISRGRRVTEKHEPGVVVSERRGRRNGRIRRAGPEPPPGASTRPTDASQLPAAGAASSFGQTWRLHQLRAPTGRAGRQNRSRRWVDALEGQRRQGKRRRFHAEPRWATQHGSLAGAPDQNQEPLHAHVFALDNRLVPQILTLELCFFAPYTIFEIAAF